jgi:osmoprotectant transport system permease protein
VELPLATPAIVAGLRVAVVTVISLATVAAFIVDKGLGGPIVDSIAAPFNTAFLAAGGLAVALALLCDGALVALQRAITPWTARRA